MKTNTKPAKVTPAQSRTVRLFGLNPADFSAVVPRTGPKRFELTLTDAAFASKSESIDRFMKAHPVKLSRFETEDYIHWIVPGVGVISASSDEDPYIEIRTLKDSAIPEFIIELMEEADSDVRWKEYGIDEKAKTIIYQCYEHQGKAGARALLKRYLKAFGLTDWKIDMPAAHWGTL